MSVEIAFRRLQEANPVPTEETVPVELADLADLVALTEQRSREMQVQDPREIATDRQPPRRRWAVAAALGAAVILIGVLAVALPQENTQFASARMTPIEVVDLWVERYETGDVEGFQALIAADATIVCAGQAGCPTAPVPYFGADNGTDVSDARESRQTYATHGTLGASCAAEGAVVECQLNQSGVFHEIGDIDPTR